MNPSSNTARLLNEAACLAGAMILLLAASIAGARQAPDLEFFEKRVRPILDENCFSCHSSKGNNPSGFALDTGVAIRKGGGRGPAIVPGHPEQSLLIKAISYEDKDLQMPPKGRLSQDHRDTLAQWIKMGAPWPNEVKPVGSRPSAAAGFDLKARLKHWSWQPVKRPAIPQIRNP